MSEGGRDEAKTPARAPSAERSAEAPGGAALVEHSELTDAQTRTPSREAWQRLRQNLLEDGSAADDSERYRVVATIALGGMGELFLAEWRGLSPPVPVVLKRLLSAYQSQRDYQAMFRFEAETMALLRHPNIVRLLDTPELEGSFCLALEYVPGRNVDQIVQRSRALGKNLPPGATLRILLDALAGLDFVHDVRLPNGAPLDLVHRDFTPGNVLVSFGGDVKITDFGIAKGAIAAVATAAGYVKGKTRYLSPEQILGGRATRRSDLYASALVAFELLAARPLFAEDTVPRTLFAIVNGERPPLNELLSPEGRVLAGPLERALALDPEARPASAKDFADALRVAAESFGGVYSAAQLGSVMREWFSGQEEPWEAQDAVRELIGRAPRRLSADQLARAPTPPGALARGSESGGRRTPGRRTEPPVLGASEAPTRIAAEPALRGRESALRATIVKTPSRPSAPAPPRVSVAPRRSAYELIRSPTVNEVLIFVLGVITGIGFTLFLELLAPRLPPPVASMVNPSEPLEDEIDVNDEGAAAETDDATEPEPETEAEDNEELREAELLAAAERTRAIGPEAPPATLGQVSPSEPAPAERAEPKPKRRGYVTILYPSGARIRIDGRLIKKRVPVRNLALSPGRHRIRLSTSHTEHKKTIEVVADRKLVLSKRKIVSR